MMKTFTILLGAALVAVVLGQVTVANAALYQTANSINLWEDNNFESMILDGTFDENGNGVIDDLVGNDGIPDEGLGVVTVGDRFLGIYKVQAYDPNVLSAPGASNIAGTAPTITAIFLLEAVRKDVPGTDKAVEIFFAPLQTAPGGAGVNDAVAGWTSVLTGLGIDTTGIIPTDDGTMAIIFQHSKLDGADETAGSLAASVNTYTGNSPGVSTTKLYEVGYSAELNDANMWSINNEFWVTAGPTGTDIPATVGITGAQNLIGVNVLVRYAGAPLVPIDYLYSFLNLDAINPTNFQAGHDFQGFGGFTTLTSDLQISTDTDLYFKPIPEPASLVVWGVLALAGSACGVRRQRRR